MRKIKKSGSDRLWIKKYIASKYNLGFGKIYFVKKTIKLRRNGFNWHTNQMLIYEKGVFETLDLYIMSH